MFLIRPLAFWFMVCLTAGQSVAQTALETMIGEYYLTGVREVGSGLKLNADYTFDVFSAPSIGLDTAPGNNRESIFY